MRQSEKVIQLLTSTCNPLNTTGAEEDYYYENNYLVFTESYLKKRGHCCKNSCRHCPYGFKNKK